MRLRINFLLLYVVLSLNSFAQNDIKYFVSDTNSVAIANVLIINIANNDTLAKSDWFGKFTLREENQNSKVALIHRDFVYKEVSLKASVYQNIKLVSKYKITHLDNIDLIEKVENLNEKSVSSISISSEDIHNMPIGLGEVDIIKSLAFISGIQSVNEGASELFIRGGLPSENLLLQDGISKYKSSHAFGFFSSYNPSIVQNVEVYKGAFPVQYDGRLSAVIDVTTKTPNLEEFHGSIGIGIYTAQAMFEIPIVKNKVSLLIASRKTIPDLFVRVLSSSGTYYGFSDFDSKLFYNINDRNNVTIDFSINKDLLKNYDNTPGYKTEAYMNSSELSLSGKWEFNYKSFSNKFQINTGKYSMLIRNKEYLHYEKIKEFSLETKIVESKVSNISTLKLADKNTLLLGVEYSSNKFNPLNVDDKLAAEDSKEIADSLSVTGMLFSVFSNYNYTNDKFSFDAGVRFNSYNSNDFFSEINPRLRISYLLTDKLSLELSYSKMWQPIQKIYNTGLGAPIEYWVSAQKGILPSTSEQIDLGIKSELFIRDTKLDFKSNVYLKKSKNLPIFKDGYEIRSFFKSDFPAYEEAFAIADGLFYGIETSIEKRSGVFGFMANYTLSYAYKQSSEINNGERFSAINDSRHVFNLILKYKINQKWSFLSTFNFSSAKPINPPTAVYPSTPFNFDQVSNLTDTYESYFIYGKRNSVRGKSFHKMDISFKYESKVKSGKNIWTFGIYNIYNRANANYYYLKNDPKCDFECNEMSPDAYSLNYVSFFPIMPAISYKYEF